MSRSVFISYRREDTGGYAIALYEKLREYFAAKDIFIDVGSIEGGSDFVSAIEQTIATADVVLILIGNRWLESPDTGRRLHEAEDFVRMEVDLAMRYGKTIVPVLLSGADMPGKEELPEGIQEFARINAVPIRASHFDEDATALVNSVAERRLEFALFVPATFFALFVGGGLRAMTRMLFDTDRTVSQPALDFCQRLAEAVDPGGVREPLMEACTGFVGHSHHFHNPPAATAENFVYALGVGLQWACITAGVLLGTRSLTLLKGERILQLSIGVAAATMLAYVFGSLVLVSLDALSRFTNMDNPAIYFGYGALRDGVRWVFIPVIGVAGGILIGVGLHSRNVLRKAGRMLIIIASAAFLGRAIGGLLFDIPHELVNFHHGDLIGLLLLALGAGIQWGTLTAATLLALRSFFEISGNQLIRVTAYGVLGMTIGVFAMRLLGLSDDLSEELQFGYSSVVVYGVYFVLVALAMRRTGLIAKPLSENEGE